VLQAILNEHTRYDEETKYDLKAVDRADGTNETSKDEPECDRRDGAPVIRMAGLPDHLG
jgi:hypothetical protein